MPLFTPYGPCNRYDAETIICKSNADNTMNAVGTIYVDTKSGGMPIGILNVYIPNPTGPNFSISHISSGSAFDSDFELSTQKWSGSYQIVNLTVSQKH